VNRSNHRSFGKLVLARETVHALTTHQLAGVAGAASEAQQCTTGQGSAKGICTTTTTESQLCDPTSLCTNYATCTI
jgi:hypothetical protein